MCRAEGGGGGGEEEITIAKNRTNMFPHVAFVYHALLLPMAPRVQHESQKDWPIVPSSSPVLSDTEAEAAFSNDGKWSWVFVGSHLELFKANSIHTTGRTVRIGALCVRHMGEEQTITSVVEIPPGKGSACGRSAPLLAISVEQSTYFLFSPSPSPSPSPSFLFFFPCSPFLFPLVFKILKRVPPFRSRFSVLHHLSRGM